MKNALIASRDAFARLHPEARLNINTREWGILRVGKSGPMLLLLPGTLGRADIFWQQIEALEGEAQILALSYPDGGSLAEWVEDIVVILGAHSFENITVLGSSLGGYLAQLLAATHPTLFTSLVAANTLPSVAGIAQFPPYSLNLETTPLGDLRAMFKAGLEGWVTEGNPNAVLGNLLLSEVTTRIPGPELRARLIALKTAPELPAQPLPKSQTFIIDSGDDHLIPPPMRAQLRAALPAARCYHFAQGSHFPYVTHPADYTAILQEVLGLTPPRVESEVSL
ncbi:MAG TPA: alpha/beta hydrolase [Rhodobacteraceae bacterium]|nr:alpha/beta hydrolase [Paracoccaceae bacterium]